MSFSYPEITFDSILESVRSLPRGSFSSIDVVRSNAVLGEREWVQFRFPRSKKKRIRKKWAKRRENWHWVEKPHMVVIAGRAYVNLPGWEVLKEALSDEKSDVGRFGLS